MKNKLLLITIFVNFFLFGQGNCDSLIHIADSLYSEQNYELAKRYCDTIIKTDTTNDYAYFIRGKINAEIGGRYWAVFDFNKAIELNPSESVYYLEKAKFNMKSKFISLSKYDFEKAIILEPYNPENYYYRSKYHVLVMNYNLAVMDIDSAIILDSCNVDYQFQKAKILNSLGKKQESIEILEEIINNNIPSAEQYFYAAVLYFENVKFDEAYLNLMLARTEAVVTENSEITHEIDFYLKDRYDTTKVNYYFSRAELLFENNKNDQAISMLQTGRQLFQKSILLTILEARIYLELDNTEMMNERLDSCFLWITHDDMEPLGFELSLKYLDDIIINKPGNVNVYAARAGFYFLLGNIQGGLHDLNYALELEPMNPDYIRTRGLVRMEELMFNEALLDFEKVKELEPDNSINYFYSAKCNYLISDYSASISNLNIAIQKDSLNPIYYSELGVCYTEITQFDMAYKMYTTAITLDSTNFNYYANRGVVNYQLGNLNASCSDIEVAKSLILNKEEEQYSLKELNRMSGRYCDSEKQGYYFERGVASYNLGRLEEAIEFYNSALDFEKESVFLLVSRANAYLELGEYNLALIDLNKSLVMKDLLEEELKFEFLELGVDYDLKFEVLKYKASIYSMICTANCGLKDYDGGIFYLEKSIALMQQSYHPEAKYFLSIYCNFYGEIQWVMQDLGLAKSYFKRSITANPNNSTAYFNMAMLIIEKQNIYGKNRPQLDYDAMFESVKTGSLMTESHQKVKKKGKLLKAKKYCDRAIHLNPEFGAAYFVRAKLKLILQEGDYCSDAKLAEEFGVHGAVSILEIDCE